MSREEGKSRLIKVSRFAQPPHRALVISIASILDGLCGLLTLGFFGSNLALAAAFWAVSKQEITSDPGSLDR